MGKEDVQGRFRHLLNDYPVQQLGLDGHDPRVPQLVIALDRKGRTRCLTAGRSNISIICASTTRSDYRRPVRF